MVWWWISLLECEEFGRMFDHSIPVRVFFLEEEISSRTLIPHLYPRISQSTVAQRAETTVSECFLTNCVSSFPDMFPHRLRWVKGVCAFRCNLPPALFGRMTVFFTCHCGNTRVERTPNKSQHIKLTPAAPAGIRTRNLSITGPTLLPASYRGSPRLYEPFVFRPTIGVFALTCRSLNEVKGACVGSTKRGGQYCSIDTFTFNQGHSNIDLNCPR